MDWLTVYFIDSLMKEDPHAVHSGDRVVKYGSTILMIMLNIYQKTLGFHCIVCALKKGVWLTFPDRWWMEVYR